MAKLQIPIPDELMAAAKIFALQNNTTLKEVVTKALQAYVTATSGITEPPKKKEKTAPKPKKEKPKPEPTPVLVPEPEPEFDIDPEPMEFVLDDDLIPDKDHYLLRKVEYEGRAEPTHVRKTNLMVEWWLEEGDSQYYDEFQNIIPFRYKKADGTDYLPNATEIKMLEEAYGKPVIIEK